MPEALGHYNLLDRLGAGRMGELYRARDTRAGRTVAVRVITPDIANNEQERQRFLADARSAAKLSHPNITILYEIGEDSGRLFLASEYVPGENLRKLMSGRGGLHPRHALDYAAQIADALAEGHAAGLIHADLSPADIIVSPKGTAKLLDFGLSSWTSGGVERRRVPSALATGAVIDPEIIAYMPPEQMAAEKVDQRSDFFTLGVILYELLLGRRAFAGETAAQVSEQVLKARPITPSTLIRAFPPELDRIVMRMLVKDRDRREETGAVLAAELRRVAGLLHERNPGPTEVVVPRRSRSAGFWIAMALLAAAVLGALWWLIVRMRS